MANDLSYPITNGRMVASGKNGFMNTNYKTCAGTPFNFHPEYNTAKPQNQVPWAALEGGVLMEQEMGHFEPCSSITNSFPYTASYADGQTFDDPDTAQTCVGGFEGPGKVREGPGDATTGVCQNATTEGGGACPSDNFTSDALCEYSDMTCAPAGPRPVAVNGTTEKLNWPIAGCQDNYFQNGDLDFDGSSYIPDWPDGSPNHPTSFAYIGPFATAEVTRRSKSRPTLRAPRRIATWRPGPGAPHRRSARRFTPSGRSAGATGWAARGTLVTSSGAVPALASAVMRNMAPPTWPSMAGHSPVRYWPTRRPSGGADPGVPPGRTAVEAEPPGSVRPRGARVPAAGLTRLCAA